MTNFTLKDATNRELFQIYRSLPWITDALQQQGQYQVSTPPASTITPDPFPAPKDPAEILLAVLLEEPEPPVATDPLTTKAPDLRQLRSDLQQQLWKFLRRLPTIGGGSIKINPVLEFRESGDIWFFDLRGQSYCDTGPLSMELPLDDLLLVTAALPDFVRMLNGALERAPTQHAAALRSIEEATSLLSPPLTTPKAP
jgi:hypothetical protein